MFFQKPDRGARNSRRQLSLEQLERREMLAADLGVEIPQLIDESPIAMVSSATTEKSAAKHHSHADPQAALLSSVADVLAAAGTRTIDGTGNNLANSELGTAGEQLLRVADADYGDGLSTPAGVDRPSAREISNALSTQVTDEKNDRQMSAFIYAWGQFIDHDIDLTLTQGDDGETLSITVPEGDPFFDPDDTGAQVITLTRSQFDEATGIDSAREQTTQITSWIDGSMVYGSDQATSDSLRSFDGGKLRTSDGDLPPTDENGFFLAGDIRANENTGLLAMQTLFIREHNLWAERIAAQNSSLSDEQIFQQARAIVIAEIQSITMNEFLPALLGTNAIDDYTGYDATVDPGIANEFSTAAFRMHTLINDDVEFFGNDGRAVHDEVALSAAFFNPDLLRETGADSVLKYLASTQSQEFDLEVVDSLRNFLFGQPGHGGLDLASLNIERGRDHGLADYNSVREAYGLERVESFADITSDVELQQKLESLYGDVDNIDLWVGVLAEDHLAGSSVGELTAAIVSDQFERLRDGDRFWYENTFSGAALRQIEATSLADIITRNTTVDNLQDDVFFMRAEVSGKAFADSNGNGRQDGREGALVGATVELLNDEGTVIATTETDARGRYRFAAVAETGDYQIRIVAPEGQTVTGPTTVDVLISSGDVSLRGINFGVDDDASDNGRDRRGHHDRHAHEVDAVFANHDVLESVLDTHRRSRRR